MRFAYTRRGGPLLDWSGVTPPYPTRAGETRSLGDFYPTVRTSNALRRYGGRVVDRGDAIKYEHNRSLGALDIPLPGAPEIVEGYESPAPGAAIIHLGGRMMSNYPWDEKYPGQTSLSGYMPEGAARNYGQTMLSADAPPAPKFDMGIVRKAGILAAAYHGVKRNNGSILGGLLWAVAAWAVFPFYGTIVPAIAVAQGFGQAKGPKQNPYVRKSERNRLKWKKLANIQRRRRSKKQKRAAAAKKGWARRRRK